MSKLEEKPQQTAANFAPNVIAVASGKGGVGKTWFSITLSHALSKKGKKVLLFDGDLGLANVDVQLGLMPERDLGGVVEGKMALKRAVTRYEEGGFDVIAGRSGSTSLASLPSERLSAIRDELIELAQSYDHVIIDLGAGVDRTARQLASTAKNAFILTTDEPTSLTDAYAFIKLSYRPESYQVFHIVVNMAGTKMEGEKTYASLSKACKNFLKFEPDLAGIVRRDNHVRDAIRNQSSLMLRSPTSDAATDIEKITTVVLGLK
jgi:flagellar biosynthesis protein FlhG